MVAIASEQERLEAWILREVENGAALPGLYPPNDANLARHAATVAAAEAAEPGPAPPRHAAEAKR